MGRRSGVIAPYRTRPHRGGGRILDDYLLDVAKYEPLTAAEEQELFRRYHSGDKSVKDKIVLSNLRFVINVAKQYMNQGMQFIDLISEGNRGLLHAVDRFDPNKNFKFISYAVWWIRQSILRAISYQSRVSRLPLNRTQDIVRIFKATDFLLKAGVSNPSVEDIARQAKMSKATVKSMLQMAARPVSLESRVTSKDGEVILGEFLRSEEDDPLQVLISMDKSDDLVHAMGSLTGVERVIVEKSYGFVDGTTYTLNEIGSMLGFSRERARQLRDRALGKIRETLAQGSMAGRVA